MTIQVDWTGTGSTPGGVAYEIYVPTADLTLDDPGPPAKYELDVNAFRLALRDLEDDPDGRPWPKTHVHDTESDLGGETYARKVRILAPYSVTFQDGQYRVKLVGANNNILDASNVNQVSIAPTNSAGLIVKPVATDAEVAIIAGAVWDAAEADHDGAGTMGYALGIVRMMEVNGLELADGIVNNWVLRDNAGQVKLRFSVADVNGDPIQLPKGYPAQRTKGVAP